MPRLLSLLLLLPLTSVAQATDETHEVWASWHHQQRLSQDWLATSDIQLRSQDGGGPWRQIILRPSVSYTLRPGLSTSIGYAYVENRSADGQQTSEHRPWQQIQSQQKLGNGTLSQRVRLEQRFIESNQGDFYSDRARLQVRYQQPLKTGKHYVALQNEVFLHLSERARLNGRTFDQNRLGLLAGWRASPQWGVELGYSHVLLGLRDDERVNHVLNVNLLTRWIP
jgi:hypothetical protein